MKSKARIAILSAMTLCLAGVLWMLAGGARGRTKLTYTQFLEQVHAGQVVSVVIAGSNSGAIQATCRLKDGDTARTVLPPDYTAALAAMQDKLVNVEIQDSSSGPLRSFLNASPFLLLLGLWCFLLLTRKFPNRLREGILG